MSVFGNYSRYYDLLYRDKNYAAEAEFIHRLIQTHAPQAKSVLDLGCGTGVHASLLAEYGYTLCGVDRSESMLQQAEERRMGLDKALSSQLQFLPGDVRTVRIPQTFDVVVSLFHVVSYQITNQDLWAAFETAKVHLKPGGLFIFDCWYGPAVLSDRPTVRVKRLHDESITVTRIAEPTIYANDNRVDVGYQILIQDIKTQKLETLKELHPMRYLFTPEVDLLFQQMNFQRLAYGDWMSDRPAGWDTWSVYFIGQRL